MSVERKVRGWRNGATEEHWERLDEWLAETLANFREDEAREDLTVWPGMLAAPVIATPGRANARLHPLVGVLEAAVRREQAKLPPSGQISSVLLRYLDFGNALEVVALPLHTETWATMRAWLPRMDARRDDVRAHYWWTRAFAALALDDQNTFRRAAGLGATEAVPFVAGETVQFNLQALLRHLGGAILAGASLRDVEPAWREVLDNYNLLSEAMSVDQGTLLWIARVVFNRIGGRPLGEVAQAFHDSAWTLAGVEP